MLQPLPGGCALAAIATAPASFKSVNYFFDHNHTCVLLNTSALRVQYRMQAFAKFKLPECTRLHLKNLNFKQFSQEEERNSCLRLQPCSAEVLLVSC